jgi:hypothetical protein
MAQTDSGFATCDISEVRAITGQESPGIGCAYNAFSGGDAGSESAAGFRGARSDCLRDRFGADKLKATKRRCSSSTEMPTPYGSSTSRKCSA